MNYKVNYHRLKSDGFLLRRQLQVQDLTDIISTENLKSIMARLVPKVIVIIGCEYNYKVLMFEGNPFDSNAAFITKKLADHYQFAFIDKAKEGGGYFLSINEEEISLLLEKFVNEFEIKAEIKSIAITEEEMQEIKN